MDALCHGHQYRPTIARAHGGTDPGISRAHAEGWFQPAWRLAHERRRDVAADLDELCGIDQKQGTHVLPAGQHVAEHGRGAGDAPRGRPVVELACGGHRRPDTVVVHRLDFGLEREADTMQAIALGGERRGAIAFDAPQRVRPQSEAQRCGVSKEDPA